MAWHKRVNPTSGLEEYHDFDMLRYANFNFSAKGWEPSAPPPASVQPEPTVDELRQREYDKQGLTIPALVVALWESQLEPSQEHTQALEAMQAKRAAIKLAIPKP